MAELSRPRTTWSLRVRYALARAAFWVGYTVLGLRRPVIRENIARSFPGLDERAQRAIRREFVLRQAELLAEVDYARRMPADELRQRMQLVDRAGLLTAQAAPSRPVILVAAHHCNFEWLLQRLSLDLGPGLVGVYKPMRNVRAERYFVALRTRFGARLLPSKSLTQELATIRSARVLGLIADQVPRTSPERHWTRFLHQETAFFRGPERLARLLRAQVVYASMRRVGRGCYVAEFQPLTAPGERTTTGAITERYARVLERDIEADPPGWWWSHRRWKIRPPSATAIAGE